MSTPPKRRHRTSFSSEADMKKEEGGKGFTVVPQANLEFEEVKDYKMEIDDPTHSIETEVLRKEQLTEEEKR